MVLVLFISLALVGERLLGLLSNSCVNRKNISKFILYEIFFYLFYRSVLLEMLAIDLAHT